ncbi:MAG: IS1595 family transposase [Vulcanimicrobiaceae bacterium]|jgi:transposase-like protein
MGKQPIPATMLEAVRQFADPKVAHDFFVQIRWPYGVACPRVGCGSAKVAYMAKARRWYCNECKGQFTAKVGTIFEDSPIGFDKWLPTIWLLASNRNGISSLELSRALKVTQKTAWFMLHRVRAAMRDGDFEEPLSGEVEADETWVGGRRRATKTTALGFHKMAHGPGEGKATVFGVVERSQPGRRGRVRAMVVPDRAASSLMPRLRANVLPGSVLYTDKLRSYSDAQQHYAHHVIDHAVRYVEGRVHTNTIENFWSVLKRTLGGTYVAPRAFHLDRYLDEQVYRFNARDEKDGPRFAKVVKRADGRRLTWAKLTDKMAR